MGIRVSTLATALFVFSASMLQAQTITAGLKAGIDFSSLPNAGAVSDPDRRAAEHRDIFEGRVSCSAAWSRCRF